MATSMLLTDIRDDIISVTLSNMTSAAPLSVVLSLISQRKEGKKRAQRRSYLKGLQILFPMFLRSYWRRSRPVLICSMSRMILILEEEEDRLRVEKFIIPNVSCAMWIRQYLDLWEFFQSFENSHIEHFESVKPFYTANRVNPSR